MEFLLDHDLHCHSTLSACCYDEAMRYDALLAHAQKAGYSTVCVTDHLWDSAVPGASRWYAPQNIAHLQSNLPLPVSEDVRFVFGCEVEYAGGGISLHPEHYDLFDFIVIPPNHFHMEGLTRPVDCVSEEQIAELYTTRLEEIIRLPLPWHKVGIAHPTCGLTCEHGDNQKVFSLMPEERLRPVFRFLAQKGAGFELNAFSFANWQEHPDSALRLYRIARDEGCRFYCASDAHQLSELDYGHTPLADVVAALGLTAEQQYRLPEA